MSNRSATEAVVTQQPQGGASRKAVSAAALMQRKREGFLVEFPTGVTVRLRRPSFTAMAARGIQITNPMLRNAIILLSGAAYRKRIGEELTADQEVQNYIEDAQTFHFIMEQCLVDLRLVSMDSEPDVAKGEVSPDVFGDADYTWVAYKWVEGDLDDFRKNIIDEGTSAA